MSSKKKILIAIDLVPYGYKAGGPIRSCASIINCLKMILICRYYFGYRFLVTINRMECINSDAWNILPDNFYYFFFFSKII